MAIPPPTELLPIMRLLPDTLLIVKYQSVGIVLDSPTHDYIRIVCTTTYDIQYYEYRLTVGIQPIDRILNYSERIVKRLGLRATLGVIQ